jgi:uncharacterized DUF497 family protein
MHDDMYISTMDYEWDPDKAAANLRRHGVDFADAVGVFEDEYALRREDPDAQGEQRFVITGIDFLGRVVVVVYTYRGERIRPISARRATRREREHYGRERP